MSQVVDYMRLREYSNSQKTDNNPLTGKPPTTSIVNVPGEAITRHNVKQTNGGKVEDTQPPAMCGFFMPATLPGDSTNLSGVYGIEHRASGNTCGVSIWTLEDSRQPYNCQNFKQTNEEHAMKTAKNHAIGTHVPAGKGFTTTPCLMPSGVLLDALTQAKTERATNGKANAYGVLLETFHRAILPAFFVECGGNLSEVSRLLGLHRGTVKEYATLANIDANLMGWTALGVEYVNAAVVINRLLNDVCGDLETLQNHQDGGASHD